MTAAPLFEIDGLCVAFERADGSRVHVVNDVSLHVRSARTTALVGESGCGKSITALAAVGLAPPTAMVEPGAVHLRSPDAEPRDLLKLSPHDLRRVRGREVAFIFQEPMTSLNPVFTIGDQIVEAVRVHERAHHRAAVDRARAALREVGMPDARLHAYPHEFSGGMRQRVMIAMALALQPRVLIADEPTTALDVTVQSQVLDVIDAARRERGLGVLLITHDLGLVAQRADEVHVMYAGRIVESAPVNELFARPAHPYTRALLECLPSLTRRRERLATVASVVGDAAGWAPIRTPLGEAPPWWPTIAGEARLVECSADHRVAIAARAVS